jgi:hypothetical protein
MPVEPVLQTPNPGVAVYIPDPVYGRTGEISDTFKSELEAEYDAPFADASIAPGFDWPAYVTLVRDHPVEAALVVFFLGERINRAVDGWIGIYNKIKTFFKHRPQFGREAAAVLAFRAITELGDNPPERLKLLGYRFHIWPELEDYHGHPPPMEIAEVPDPLFIGVGVHIFHIEADEKKFIVYVEGTKIEVATLD